MPRPYRIQLENCLYHVFNRGNNKRVVFPHAGDYEKFLISLNKIKRKYHVYLYAYALMPNHYHLLIETKLPNIANAMQYLLTSYTTYHNTKYEKQGHLFQGRYKSIIVDKDSYLLELTRYIHLNPVRAKMVRTPGKYEWSSYREFVGRIPRRYVDKKELSQYCPLWGEDYRDFVEDNKNKKFDFFEKIYGGAILGGPDFVVDKLKKYSPRRLRPLIPATHTYDDKDILDCVGNFYQVCPNELCAQKRKYLLARRIAIYMLKQKSGLKRGDIGKKFNVSPSAVTRALQQIEEDITSNKKIQQDLKKISTLLTGRTQK